MAISEKKKYEQLWQINQYRKYSPGEEAIPVFRQLARKKGTLLDIGCGTGRAGNKLNELGWKVTLLDFADNAPEVDLPFLNKSLFDIEGEYEYGYCCDVMEHLSPRRVNKALKTITSHVKNAFFSIHFGPDNFGNVIGHPLHLTVKPFTWWRDKLKEYGKLKDARDCIGIGYYYVQN